MGAWVRFGHRNRKIVLRWTFVRTEGSSGYSRGWETERKWEWDIFSPCLAFPGTGGERDADKRLARTVKRRRSGSKKEERVIEPAVSISTEPEDEQTSLLSTLMTDKTEPLVWSRCRRLKRDVLKNGKSARKGTARSPPPPPSGPRHPVT